MPSPIEDCLRLPPDAAAELRQHLGKAPGDELRLGYFCGPGDVEGTFRHWLEGRHDPRVPVFSYSGQFYELTQALKAEALVVTTFPRTDTICRGRHVDFCRVQGPHTKSALRYYMSELAVVYRTITALRRFQPDITVTTTDFPLVGWPLLRGLGRVVLSMHNTFYNERTALRSVKQRIRRQAIRLAGRYVDAALCVSEDCRRQALELCGATTPTFLQVPQLIDAYATRDRQAARHLVYLGRVEHNKGVLFLVDVFEKLLKKGLPLTLTIAGDGGASGDLRARVATLPAGSVRLAGLLDSRAVHALLDEVDLLICPTMGSFNEGLAKVPLEAAAHGVPSIVSSVVPARDLLGDACIVYPADDADALERAIETIVTDDTGYRQMCDRVFLQQSVLQDREKSWATQLYAAMMST